MRADAPLNARLAGEIKGRALVRAVIVLAPFGLACAITANPLWLKVSLLAIATMIPEERLALTPQGVLLHGLTVIAGIYLLLFAQQVPALFVMACMLLAAGTIWIAAAGTKLRALGSWTFIPVLILANELGSPAEPHLDEALRFLPYLLIPLIPTFAVAVFKSRRARGNISGMRWFSRLGDFGPATSYGETMAAMVVGVGLAAALVEYNTMHHGQWMIWGAASVIAGTVDSARAKLRSRAIGVVAGVPLGIALGTFVIPHSGISVTVATLATFLTLVAFERYVVAYFFRCTLVALSIVLANQSVADALERLTHVLLGGAIGMASVIVFHIIAGNMQARTPQ
ncbi:FUSC family protein [Pseudomonas chlororaphis]|uniref:FUSC family protein n=1 Tax=Pseudomonas chlororaphis TaxID=587753 RepID=UPI0015DE2869|nr:FUSC family protein [Pseudomonas chlororaphis]QLL16102.1 FUSC family protein [Pseudomonas chlororaphis subsp. aurantiaca]